MQTYMEYLPSPRGLMSEKHLFDQLLAADVFHLLSIRLYIVRRLAFLSVTLPSLRRSWLML